MYANDVGTVFVMLVVFPRLSLTVALTDKVSVSASPVPDTLRENDPADTVAVPAVPTENVTVAVFPLIFKYVPVAVPVQLVTVLSLFTVNLMVGDLLATYVT